MRAHDNESKGTRGIASALSRLPEEEQLPVLAFAKGLVPTTVGIQSKDLLKLSGAIDHADLQR